MVACCPHSSGRAYVSGMSRPSMLASIPLTACYAPFRDRKQWRNPLRCASKTSSSKEAADTKTLQDVAQVCFLEATCPYKAWHLAALTKAFGTLLYTPSGFAKSQLDPYRRVDTSSPRDIQSQGQKRNNSFRNTLPWLQEPFALCLSWCISKAPASHFLSCYFDAYRCITSWVR